MQKKLKGFYLLVSSLVIALLYMPIAFAKSAVNKKLFLEPKATVNDITSGTIATAKSAYDSLHLEFAGLSRQAYEYAKKGFDKLVAQGKVLNSSIISIADFSQPSGNKRLYIIDLKNYRLLYNTWVAHGRNSGLENAQSFSNDPSSFKSSPGFYVTQQTYNGKHGYSLKLEGVEKGINDHAQDRAIVIHGAEYVNPSLVEARGFIGRSLGCPAVPVKLATPIINTIKDGTCLFIYNPDNAYLQRSSVLS